MADKKITALTELSAAPDVTDLLHVVDGPGGTPVNKKLTFSTLFGANVPTSTVAKSVAGTAVVLDPAFRQNLVTSTETGALSIADGTVAGQIMHVVKVAGNEANAVTPADTLGDWASIALTDVGDNASLLWTGTAWIVTSSMGGDATDVSIEVA
jgi:hypothetical protein|tara:strand:- start:626 stop:1087 length:462 start_codon:yes stop_codon:yes gene_type:complete